MRYLIFLDANAESPLLGPVPEAEKNYLDRAKETLQDIDREGFQSIFAPLFYSAAKISYILDRDSFYALVEWEPGLILLSASGDGQYKWTALRSPIPEFGGREPLPQDEEEYDEDAPNYQYDLIFGPWDAQFDEEYRQDSGFVDASEEDLTPYRKALRELEPMFATAQANQDSWNRIESLTGEGIRLKAELE